MYLQKRAVVMRNDRPKLVGNRNVIEIFAGGFARFNFSVGIKAFVNGLRHISSIFLFTTLL